MRRSSVQIRQVAPHDILCVLYMKKIFSTVILFLLTAFARTALKIHKPFIIAITGSVGKTTTKDMIAGILRTAGMPVRSSRKSYNGEFGVPLSIFDLPTGMRNPFIWIYVLCVAFFRMLFSMPKFVVLEVGLETPGDIANIVRWLRPDMAVLTRLPANPVHLENFPDKESLYQEKMSLLRAVKKDGIAVYNAEDDIQKMYIADMPDTISLRAFNSDSIFIEETRIHYDGHNPVGMDVVLSLNGEQEPFYIPETLGTGVVQSFIAAVTTIVNLYEVIPMQTIRRAIASRHPTPGRMRILPGYNGSTIIDDSYNASPIAMEEALRTLAVLEKQKKIAILGVMAQLGPDSEDMHRILGNMAEEIAHHVFVAGDAYYGNGPNTHYLKNHHLIVKKCKELADTDTVFFCKGSQIARLEYITEALLAPDTDPKKHLVRQESHWKREG